jgi:hypothetical protein
LETLLIQDWITLQFNAKLNLTQGAHGWVDVGHYEDVLLYVDIKEQSGLAATLALQTAPVAQDAAFVPVANVPVAAGLTTISLLGEYSNVPVGRLLRWQFIANGTSTATFRIWAAAYSLA